MKTKNIFLSLAALLFVAAMPLKAQDGKVTNYFKNNPALGGDVVINDLSQETAGNECLATFHLTAPSAGEYYMNFWLLPAKYVDNTYTAYKVLVNGNNVGTIVPVKGNWQTISLPDNGKVSLQKGHNTVTLATAMPEIPQVEFVRLSKVSDKAVISSAAFDAYLSKAKNSEMGISPLAMEVEDAAIEPELKESLAVLAASPEFRLFTNLPLKYSIRTSYQFTAGQEIFITTNSVTKHILDFYIDDSYGDPQYLSWLNLSETSLNYPTKYLATIRATIPITGRYWVKVRSYSNEVSGTVNINVNGQYSLVDSPIYYSGRSVTIPADGNKYAAFTMSTDSDPYLFMEGAGSTPGKIVAYRDDSPTNMQDLYGIRSYDPYLEQSYSMPVKGVHVTNYSSSNPESKCKVAVQTSPASSYAAPRKSNGTGDPNGATGMLQTSMARTCVYPNPVDASSVLNIASGEEIRSVQVYDLSGRLVGSKKINGTQVQIPLSELNMGKGMYMLKLNGMSGSVTKRLIVN